MPSLQTGTPSSLKLSESSLKRTRLRGAAQAVSDCRQNALVVRRLLRRMISSFEKEIRAIACFLAYVDT